MMELTRYDAMCTAIQACHSVDEVTDIRNKAMALEAYAKQAMNTHAERQACAIRLRAERHAGQLLSEQERDPISKGGSRSADQPEPPKSEYQQAKIKANISDSQAKRWQLLAEVDPLVFESALEDPKKKPSTSGIIKKVNGSAGKMDPKALWLWGRLRDYERDGIMEVDPEYLLGEMTDTMQADVKRIVRHVIDYFELIEETVNDQPI